MKFLGVILAIFVVICGTMAWNDLPDYCGKPCREPGGITCAYNQQCYQYFTSVCEMRKRNCDFNDRFMAVDMRACMLSPNKCR